MNTDAPAPQTRSLLTKHLLPAAVAVILAACGGGGGYGGGGGNNNPPPPPPVTLADGQFVLERIEGLGVHATGTADVSTDATGKFKFVVGQDAQLFVGQANDRLVVGTVTPTAANGGVAPIGLQDFKEVQNDQDQVLGNVLVLLRALDADGDPTNGVTIDAAANTAVAKAVAGGKTVNFNQTAAAFAADPVIVAVLADLNKQLGDAKAALLDFTELFTQSRSSSIALTSDNSRVVVANRQKSSVSVIRVRDANGADAEQLLAEITVGKEPRYVAISPDDKRAFVTSAVAGTMTAIDLTLAQPAAVGTPVDVGVEPRGVAVTPNGTYAFIANHTVGEVTIVKLSDMSVVGKVHTGGNPQAVVITNDGDRKDDDERVFVTRMFGELIDPARPDGFDDAKKGVIDTFTVGAAVAGNAQVAQLNLQPFAAGFNADRRQFCTKTREALEVGVNGEKVIFFNSGANGVPDVADNNNLANETFCPDVNSDDAAIGGVIQKVAQKVYPNMLFSALVRGGRLYVPNEGASPEPPVRFNVNVQGLVGVIDRTKAGAGAEDPALSLNLNSQVAKETQPAAADEKNTLDRVFLNDLVAVDADRFGRNFLFVSRGGNYVMRASLDATGKLNILDGGAPTKAKRLQTGNMPTGVVMSGDGTRAYANNEINTSVTSLDLTNNVVLKRDINSSTPPAPGTQEHRNLVGKLVFFTALGVPDVLDTNADGQFDVALREIDPLKNRNKASDNGWSSCASCHDDGHSDNVTWIFETGPRQTIPLEGMFTHDVPDVAGRLLDSRVLNWSAVRGSNTDFNANSIGIQGGKGFATETQTGDHTGFVFNHGPIFGVSDSLDALQEWVTTVRAPIVPQLANATAGRAVFEENCASCHGGAKWTKSQTLPLFDRQPATNSGLLAVFAQNPIGVGFFDVGGVKPFDLDLAVNGPQLLSVAGQGGPLKLLDDVGTFAAANTPAGRLEIRGAAAVGTKETVPGVQSTQGFGAFGLAGFNSPSLLGLSLSAPYFHDGSAQTLEEVAARHKITTGGNAATIQATLTQQQLADVLSFVRTIDDGTQSFKSATEVFLEQQ